MNKPELLSPAGDGDSLDAALRYGADAVYGGMKRFGLRAFAGNFGRDELAEAVRKAHALNRKFYLTMNIFPWDDEMEAFVQAAGEAREMGTDAVIVSDAGAIRTLRRRIPGLPVHVSTQANTLNTASAEIYLEWGCERIILAREMSLERIRAMKRRLGDRIELEMFVHGASCVAYSGRCLLSAALNGRSANRGECTQPCRWKYSVVEEKRPGEYMPVTEDGRGTYLFSAKDLCLMRLLPELVETGISSLKIEGRMKTEYYVAVVTGAYRRGLDLLAEGGAEAFRQALPELEGELRCASHRESDTGFLEGAPAEPGGADGFHQEREYVGRIVGRTPDGRARILLKNRFFAGETLEVMTPEGIRKGEARPFVRESTGETLTTCGIGGEILVMELDEGEAGDLIRGPVRNHRQ